MTIKTLNEKIKALNLPEETPVHFIAGPEVCLDDWSYGFPGHVIVEKGVYVEYGYDIHFNLDSLCDAIELREFDNLPSQQDWPSYLDMRLNDFDLSPVVIVRLEA